jgi:Ca-activated chloride channel family protein
VIDLGLQFSLVTRWTAFVAVSEKIYNPDVANTKSLPVPLQKVKGVSKLAYSESSNRQTAQFSGGSTPEPRFFAGLILALLISGIFINRRKAHVLE